MNPRLRPECLITMVNRDSTTIYSGMFPGLVAGDYQLDEISIDLRRLTDQAGVSLILGEIDSLDLSENKLFLHDRPALTFSKLSLNIGSETFVDNRTRHNYQNKRLLCPIKPFRNAYSWIKSFDIESEFERYRSFTIIGSGFSAIEMAFALRRRWPKRNLKLQSFSQKLHPSFKKALKEANISLDPPDSSTSGPKLICTGNKASQWLENSGLKVDKFGRIITHSTLQVAGYPHIFAVGDCGVVANHVRPPSGVWAVRVAKPLARNLEKSFYAKRLSSWKPQKQAIQLITCGNKSMTSIAWLSWRGVVIGPNRLFLKLKKNIDQKFIKRFSKISEMNKQKGIIACRGCAAKISSQPLKAALKEVELCSLSNEPEDAALIHSSIDGFALLQSVDGFPALLNDPWLNARLTTLHACSDLWARGAVVSSAQAIIKLPAVQTNLQEQILTQCLAGIKSALVPQGAALVGGHTFESRSAKSTNIISEIEISLCVNGMVSAKNHLWSKGGLQHGDQILISRSIGTGVIFAAAMRGAADPICIDVAIAQISESQHSLMMNLQEMSTNNASRSFIHACTDITGFGLLGHLGEMIQATNFARKKASLPEIRIKLFGDLIPSLPGAKNLFKEGYESTLAPLNRSYLKLLNFEKNCKPLIELICQNHLYDMTERDVVKRLIVDPQTCGPLVISCEPILAKELVQQFSWTRIGEVDFF